jgi:hypothetical protein
MLRYNGADAFLMHDARLRTVMKRALRLVGKEPVGKALNVHFERIWPLCEKHWVGMNAKERRGMARRLKRLRAIHRQEPHLDAVCLIVRRKRKRGGELVLRQDSNLQQHDIFQRLSHNYSRAEQGGCVNYTIATIALLAATTAASAQQLGDPVAWDAQLAQCRADPTHVERVMEAPGLQWLNECTVTRGPMRYRMVTVTRWWVPIDQHICALGGNIAVCRDYWTGMIGCFAPMGPDAFLWPAECTEAHQQLWPTPIR